MTDKDGACFTDEAKEPKSAVAAADGRPCVWRTVAQRDATVTVTDGSALDYRETLTLVPVRRSDADARPVGTMSVTSFEKLADGRIDARRPVLAMFNGGPIVASTALLLSGIGPCRIAFSDDLNVGARGPFALEDSAHTVLTDCDILVMDPIGCGYGTYAADVDVKERYTALEDARQFADGLVTWLTRTGRIGSPVFILGESYGTVRAPLLARALLEHPQGAVAISGTILMGATTNIQEVHDRLRSIVAPAASLSLMAATAWYHGKSGIEADDVAQVIDAAREYAQGPYLRALWQGSRCPQDEREKVAARLEEFTGIGAGEWLRSRLNISKNEFRARLLRDEGRVVGVYDARYSAKAEFGQDPDPSDLRISPAIHACAMDFYASMGVPRDLPRTESPGDVWPQWDWSVGDPSDSVAAGTRKSPFDEFDYTGALEYCLTQIDGCRLMVVNGCYDTITTVGAADALIASMDVTADQVEQRIYPAGHMTYTDRASARQLDDDLVSFIRATLR